MPTTGPSPAVPNKPSAGRRAGLLAARIEEGAARLAALAEGLSDADWRKPASATDRRPIGLIVHHVGFVYPPEVDLARAIAAGKPVADLTWEAIAQLNARHALDHANVSKAEAIEFLRQKSREAAEAIRAFTDEELDRSGEPGLYFGAPVTAGFVIEDHAVRHSWHHVAKIRAAVGR